MDSNPYAAPSSEVAVDEKPSRHRFYVVAPTKFFVLFIATLGLYQLYWHYKNWSLLKQARRSDEWPVMRAIFSIFFTHAMFREIDKELVMNRHNYAWRPEIHATIIVIILIADRIISRISDYSEDFTALDGISLLSVPALAYLLFQAQKAANLACGDPYGKTNANYTVANIIWIVLGGLFLLLIGLGLVVMMFPEA